MTDDPSMAELGWRMTALEARMAEAAKASEAGIAALRSDIAGLSFVPRGEYVIEMRAMADQIKATHAIAMWALGTVVGGVLIAILVTLVLRSSS